ILKTLFTNVVNMHGTLADMTKNTDFTCDGKVVAARNRSPKDWKRYVVGKGEVTFRFSRPSTGAATEWEKMLAGHGDFAIFTEVEESMDWLMIDLSVIRYLMVHAEGLDLSAPIPQAVYDSDTNRKVVFQPI